MKGNGWRAALELGSMNACYLKFGVNPYYLTHKPGVAGDACHWQLNHQKIITGQGRHSWSHLEAASRHDLTDNMAMGFLLHDHFLMSSLHSWIPAMS